MEEIAGISETANTAPGADDNLRSLWGCELAAMVCEHCDWSFLAPLSNLPERCPRCFHQSLQRLDAQIAELPYVRPPEICVPFSLASEALERGVQEFAGGIPYPPGDLDASYLNGRMQRLYLPVWLLDAEVSAEWQAEAGFNYQVVSHQDRYDESRGGWSSREVKEGRIRWEPRLGRLQRGYQNLSAPALEEDQQIRGALGDFDISKAVSYQPALLDKAVVRLPNRSPDDAWSDAQAVFQNRAADECRQAAGADHIRQYRWRPEFANRNWTLMLLPVYATYYLDDERVPRPVLVHGQTGRVRGARRASMQRAGKQALILACIAMAIFLLSLVLGGIGLVFPPLVVVGIIGFGVALLFGAGAVVPLARAWLFNRKAGQFPH